MPNEKKISFLDASRLSQIQDSKLREDFIKNYGKIDRGPKVGVRHIQVGLMFMCLSIGIAMRTSLSTAIVAMTDSSVSDNPDIPTYNWTNKSVILSSFFWGYLWLQILAGYLGNKYGPKYFLLPAYCINSIAFLLIPLIASKFGSKGVMVCRVIQGLASGFLYPSSHAMLGKWAPAEESSTMGIIVYSGLNFASVLSSIITGYISSSWAGWPASFYFFGSLGLGWALLFLVFGHNSPAVHPSITSEERNYIETSLGQLKEVEEIKIPWKSLLTCLPLWAIVSANAGGAFGYTMTMTEMPTYFANVKKFKLSTNGLVTALPYIGGTLSGLIFAPIADYLIAKKYLSKLNVRRTFQLLGSYGLTVALLLLAFVPTTKFTAVLFLTIGNSLYAATLVGYSVNHVDLSPRFCGIMQGISNGLGQSLSLVAPLMVQFVVTDQDDASQWQTVFLITAIVYVVCSTFYATFTSATRQQWDGSGSELTEKMARMKKISVMSLSGY